VKESGREKKSRLFVLWMELDATDDYVLHVAANDGDIDQVEQLLTRYPLLVDSVDDKGMTALHCAADNGRGDCSTTA